MGSTLPGGYSTVIIKTSLPGKSGRSFEVSGVTEACGALLASGCWAISVRAMRQNTTSKNILFIMAPLVNCSVTSSHCFSINSAQELSYLGMSVLLGECHGTLICRLKRGVHVSASIQ